MKAAELTQLKQAGVFGDQIQKPTATMPTQPPAMPEQPVSQPKAPALSDKPYFEALPYSLGATAKTLIPSLAKNLWGGIKGVPKMIKELSDKDKALPFLLNAPQSIINDMVDTYGKGNLTKTLEENPARLLMDLSTAFTLGSGAASLAGKAAMALNAPEAASIAGSVAKYGAMGARITNPLALPGAALRAGSKMGMTPFLDEEALQSGKVLSPELRKQPVMVIKTATTQQNLLQSLSKEFNKLSVATSAKLPYENLSETVFNGIKKTDEIFDNTVGTMAKAAEARGVGKISLPNSIRKVDDYLKTAGLQGGLANKPALDYMKTIKDELTRPQGYVRIRAKLQALKDKIDWSDPSKWAENSRLKGIVKTVDDEMIERFSAKDPKFREDYTTFKKYFGDRQNEYIDKIINAGQKDFNTDNSEQALQHLIKPGASEENIKNIYDRAGANLQPSAGAINVKAGKMAQDYLRGFVLKQIIKNSLDNSEMFNAGKLEKQLSSHAWGDSLEHIFNKSDADMLKSIKNAATQIKKADNLPSKINSAILRHSISAFGINDFVSTPIGKAWIQNSFVPIRIIGAAEKAADNQ